MQDARRTMGRAIFVSVEGRPRALWRILIFLAIALGIALPVVPLVAIVVDQTIGGRELGFSLGMCAALVLAHWIVLARIEKRGWDAVGLDREAARPSALARGAVLGATAISVPVIALWALGWMRVEPAAPGSSLVQAARAGVVLAPAALLEELLMRGYIFTALREGLGLAGALAVTSVVFGLMHWNNPGATAVALGMVTLAGVLLGMVLVATRSLYAATAAHFAWNFVLAGVMHVAVSGLGFMTPDYRIVETGPDWMTGGSWGPEGGVAAGLGMTAALAYLIARPWRRREL